MESYTMSLDWKNQHCENDSTTHFSAKQTEAGITAALLVHRDIIQFQVTVTHPDKTGRGTHAHVSLTLLWHSP